MKYQRPRTKTSPNKWELVHLSSPYNGAVACETRQPRKFELVSLVDMAMAAASTRTAFDYDDGDPDDHQLDGQVNLECPRMFVQTFCYL